MLVLGRFVDEEIVVISPDGIELSLIVVEVKSEKVRLGFQAPKDWGIYRREVLDRIRESQSENT